MEWDIRYIKLAKGISGWSKDPSRKIGAVCIGKHGQVLSQGFNGFPRGVNDYHERLNNREEKHKFIVHAEMNCIYNACLNGTSLEGSTIYVYGLPACSECAKGIIQSGISRVVIHVPEEYMNNYKRWSDSWELSRLMFEEVGINVMELNGDLN